MIGPEVLYSGIRGKQGIGGMKLQRVTKQVLPDGETTEFGPEASFHFCDHSPNGFSWGYGGSGPAQLAFGLILDVTGNPEITQDVYQGFKDYTVSRWGDYWQIETREVLDWISRIRKERQEYRKSLERN